MTVSILGDWKAWIIIIDYVISFGGYLTFASYLPNYMDKYHGLDRKPALLFNAAFLIISSLNRSGLSPITDKIGGAKSTFIGICIVAVGCITMGFSVKGEPWGIPAIAGLLIVSIGLGLTNAAVFKWIPKIFIGYAGEVGAYAGAIGATGGFFLPIALGAMGGATNPMALNLITGMCVVMNLCNICLIMAGPNPPLGK